MKRNTCVLGWFIISGLFIILSFGCETNDPTVDPVEGWTKINSPFEGSLYCIEKADNNTLYIGGATAIMKSEDAGVLWTKIYDEWNSSHHIPLANCMYWHDADNGMVGANGGLVFKTTDGGSDWTEIEPNLPNGFAIRTITFATPSIGFTGGVCGEIAKTTNGGNTWYNRSLPYCDKIFDMHFFDHNIGILAGEDGMLRITNDGSNTWSEITSGTTESLNKICFLDATIGYIAGNGGVILHTQDGGNSWAQQIVPVQADLRSIAFRDSNNGYAVGSNGTILKTEDGGTSWLADTSPVTNDLYDIVFMNDHFIIVGLFGTILSKK